jgi:hypothetical protein
MNIKEECNNLEMIINEIGLENYIRAQVIMLREIDENVHTTKSVGIDNFERNQGRLEGAYLATSKLRDNILQKLKEERDKKRK